jgi:hypothetical protein
MKQLLFLFVFLMNPAFMQAQFSADSTQPMKVCDTTNEQLNVLAISDGQNGSFVFWVDRRFAGPTN